MMVARFTAPASTTVGRPTTRAAINFGFTPGSVGQTGGCLALT
jgi:hypothetical protein